MPESADLLTSVLPVGGIAAVVAAAVTYLLRITFETRLKAGLERDLEYLKEIVKDQAEHFQGLGKAVYQSRNIVRDIVGSLPQFDPGQRSRLGDSALGLTERLYEARVFLPRSVFEKLHSYKNHLQRFVFDYDQITGQQGSKPKPALVKSLKQEYEEIDKLYNLVLGDIQKILKVN